MSKKDCCTISFDFESIAGLNIDRQMAMFLRNMKRLAKSLKDQDDTGSFYADMLTEIVKDIEKCNPEVKKLKNKIIRRKKK